MRVLWKMCCYIFLPAIMALCVAPLARGQAFVNGAITGTVTDTTGAVVPGVALTLTNLGTGAKLTAQTDTTGLYRFPNLPPGEYSLGATKSGFKHFTRQPIRVLVNTKVGINIVLQVGAVTQVVEVKAATPLIEPTTSSLGQVIGTQMVNQLPLNGRNPLALVSLVPGVVPQGGFGSNPVTQNPFSQGNVQINGGAANQSAAYWDGAPLNSTGYINLLALEPSQDAVSEFKVQTDNLSAKYGRFAGGIISFTTKTGTNHLHGNVYEFLRNKVLNANTFFNNAAGVPVGAFTQNQFGGTIGGPVDIPGVYNGKNKTFFFVSYDGFRLREGLPLLFSVPTVAERNGNFSGLVDASGNQIPIYDPLTTCGTGSNPACATDAQGNPIYTRQQFSGNIIPQDRLDSTAKILANLWALPNVPGTQNGEVNNWAGNASEGGNNNETTVRIDQNVSNRQRIFGRYTIMRFNNLAINPFGTNAYPLQIGTPEFTQAQQAVFDDSFTLSPTKVLDVELTWLRDGYTRTPGSSGYDLSQLGPGWAPLNNQVNFRTLPNLQVSGITDFSSGETGSTIKDFTDDYDLLPNFTMVQGRNTIQIGGDFRLGRFNYGQVNQPSGFFTFDQGFTQLGPTQAVGGYGFASYMLGAMSGGTISTINLIAAQQHYDAWYVEDDLHATRKLTLNLGFRYNRDGAFTERFNRISTFIGNAPNSLIQNTSLPAKGTIALVDSPLRPQRTGFNVDNNQFAPRFGLAYAFTPKTVFRGGYGIFWLPDSISWGGNNPATDGINLYNNSVVNTINGGLTPYNYLSNPFPNGINAAPGRNPAYAKELIGQGPQTQIPTEPYAYVQQWNVDLQRTLPGGFFVSVAYAGSKGTHLDYSYGQLDQLPDQYLSMGNALLNLVPNPYYGIVTGGPLSAQTVQQGQLLRPFPQYNGLGANRYFGNSSYNALQVKMQKRFSSGGTLLVAYTNSKLITDAETVTSWLDAAGAGGIQDWNNIEASRSVSGFDIPQRLVVSYVLDLPVGHGQKFMSGASGLVGKLVSGWGLQGITTIVPKGYPVSLSTSSNTTNSYGGGQTPNYNANAPGCSHSAALSGAATSRLNEWFNTACFSQPAPFTFGNVSRTSPRIRMDGQYEFDTAFVKNTTFGPGEKLNLQFRAEFFNLFNHPQFGPPGGSYGTTGFGVVSGQLNNPRLLQFGLNLSF